MMEKNDDKSDEDLATIQKTIEIAASKVAHNAKAEREQIIQSTPQNVSLREEAAAKCTKKIQRKVLKKQARKARADHLVKRCLELGKKKVKRKPLTELDVKGISQKTQKRGKRNCKGTEKK